MSTFRPVRALPASPNLEQQKKQARELLDAMRAGNPAAVVRGHAAHPNPPGSWKLADAQLVVAREYGFASWPRFKQFIEQVNAPGATEPFVADRDWYAGRVRGLQEMHRGALPNALAQIRAWHPRFASMTDEEIAAAPFSVVDAATVYVRQNGASTWEELVNRAAALADDPTATFAQAFAAIEGKDVETLRTVVEQDPSLLIRRGTNGNTLLNLAVAIEKDDGPMVQYLVARGADPNIANDRGWTPLHQAQTVALVDRLLAAGAAPTISAHGDGGTPLAVALFWNGIRGARVAARLAEVAVVPDNLRINAALNHDLGRFFLADGSLSDEAGMSRGFYRPHSGFPAWRPSNERQEILDEALIWAARNDALRAMQQLVDAGADVNGAPYRGTALMHATYTRHHDAVRWLLERGADINQFVPFHGMDTGGVSALHLAVESDDVALLRLLLEHGADRSIKDGTYNATPLGWAEHLGCGRAAEVLGAYDSRS